MKEGEEHTPQKESKNSETDLGRLTRGRKREIDEKKGQRGGRKG